ncbi:LexA family protein [Psychrobacillus sp. FSL K6-1415]|uniref:LexA family protein n=1 Tax=Psychrobacillus sp. FSL K6-1415 TaxID=2921544 RepID=UPI0030F5E84C
MNRRQKEIYEYIKHFLAENKYSPSMREVGNAVGIKSSSTIHKHLDNMRKNGYIDFINSSPRTLQIIR